MKVVRFWVTILLFCGLLAAHDDQQTALAAKAQADFERVALVALAALPETAACAQSQAAILSVSPPEDLASLHYRKGYCLLAGATLTANRQDFSAAAGEFDKAIEAWPARVRKAPKNTPPEPVSGGLRALDGLAHLHAESEAAGQAQLSAAVSSAACSPGFMPETVCRQWVETARLWLGRMALRAGNLNEAAANLKSSPQTGWQDWALGKQAFESADYRQAVSRFSAAIEIWRAVWSEPGPGFARRLGPRPDLAQALTELGGAQLLTGPPKAAIASLDAALKMEPASARTLFLRARAREISGHAAEALEDYNLAARAAFAASEDLASGEAHLYRGILLFRRKDYARAEDEFSSALNFAIARGMRPDAEAWRYLAAVASGFCAAARRDLERSLSSVSPFFPKDEARTIAGSCSGKAN